MFYLILSNSHNFNFTNIVLPSYGIFWGGAYGSLPNAAIWWCLQTGSGGVLTSILEECNLPAGKVDGLQQTMSSCQQWIIKPNKQTVDNVWANPKTTAMLTMESCSPFVGGTRTRRLCQRCRWLWLGALTVRADACLVTVQGIPTISGRYSNDLSGHMSTTLLKDI